MEKTIWMKGIEDRKGFGRVMKCQVYILDKKSGDNIEIMAKSDHCVKSVDLTPTGCCVGHKGAL